MASTSFRAFADELDDLIEKYRGDRWRLSVAEAVGALMTVVWKLIQETQED